MLQRGLRGRAKAKRQTGVVDEHVDIFPVIRHGREETGDRRRIRHVQRARQQLGPQFGGELFQPLDTPSRGDDAMAVANRTPGDGLAETGGGAGDQKSFHNANLN